MKLLSGAKFITTMQNDTFLRLVAMSYHSSKGSLNEELSCSSEWYEKAFMKITKLSQLLRNVDLIDGRLFDIRDGSIIVDNGVEQKMVTFKSLARELIGSRSVRRASKAGPVSCFDKPSEREPLTLSSLTQVGNLLNISAQQRKVIRAKICPQVTQHRIWIGTLDEILNGLKPELDYLNSQYPIKGTHMGQQIVANCLKIFDDAAVSADVGSTSWMRLAPAKAVARSSASSLKWEDVLEMFNDLIECLRTEDKLLNHVVKLEAMKEGLCQIKDGSMDKSIGYKGVRHQESLVKKKLSSFLGYSSPCLFTLLLYYLCGQVRDIEVDLCGGLCGNRGKDRFRLCIGRVATSDEEKMVLSGVRQLDRTLGLFKFVWEIAGMKQVLDLQGHLWCVGAETKMLEYNGKRFFIHGITI